MKPAFPGQTIPASAFMIFQAMFAAITPGIYPYNLSTKAPLKKANECRIKRSPCIRICGRTYVGKLLTDLDNEHCR